MMPLMKHSFPFGLIVLALIASGCKDGQSSAGAKQSLGSKSANGYELAAYQSGPIDDGELDLVVTGGAGKPKAVRFWVGVESESDSAKALAGEETSNNWHTHPKIPKPLPADAQFWVEIEPPSGTKFKVAFDVKR
jgi:hypothetical protein